MISSARCRAQSSRSTKRVRIAPPSLKRRLSQCYASGVERITSRQNAVVAHYRAAAHGDGDGLVLLDGAHLVADALAARIPLQHLMVAAEAQDEADIRRLVDDASAHHVTVAVASSKVMEAASPVKSSSPIIALASRKTLASDVYASTPPLVIIACDVQDPGNLGAIARVAEAAGASGLIAAGQSADPHSWKALRGSMGSALRLPIGQRPTAEAAVAEARRHGCRVVATLPRGGTPLSTSDLRAPAAILIGGEGRGLPKTLVDAADVRLTIPMEPPVESLNAAVTAALVAYEVRRQRR
jgi:RNA methyltransferase, TrmH family